MKAITIYILLAFLCYNIAKAQQQVIATGGDYNSIPSGSLCWTLGESVIETYSSNGQILTQGFQQVNLTVNDFFVSKELQTEISVFPNPASDYVSLKIGNLSEIKESAKTEGILYELTDMNGKILKTEKLIIGNQQIYLNNLAAGTYFLSIIGNSNLTLKTFKIVKQ